MSSNRISHHFEHFQSRLQVKINITDNYYQISCTDNSRASILLSSRGCTIGSGLNAGTNGGSLFQVGGYNTYSLGNFPILFNINYTPNSGVEGHGIEIANNYTSSSLTGAIVKALNIKPKITLTGSATVSNSYGMYIENPVISGTAPITNHGLYVSICSKSCLHPTSNALKTIDRTIADVFWSLPWRDITI